MELRNMKIDITEIEAEDERMVAELVKSTVEHFTLRRLEMEIDNE
jgi:hypothetical protein